MITLTQRGHSHRMKYTWHDLTLTDAMKLRDIELPTVTDEFDWHIHQPVMIAALTVLSDTVDWRHTNPIELEVMFRRYALPLMNDLKRPAPETYTPKLIESFTHNGTTYLMPEHLIIDDLTVLQHTQETERFIEASNLMKSYAEVARDGLKAMASFVAVVCKTNPAERYDEAVVMRRAKEFETLPMWVVWEVFFCISLLTAKSLTATLRYISQRPVTPANESPLRWDLRLGRLRLRRRAYVEQLKRSTVSLFGKRSKYLIT